MVSIDNSDEVAIYDGRMKLRDIVEFVEPFALPKEHAKPERVISSTGQASINNAKTIGYTFVDEQSL